MRAVHAVSLCEKTTLPLQKRNLKPKEYNSNDERGDFETLRFQILPSIILRIFPTTEGISNYDIYWANQNARFTSSLIEGQQQVLIKR